MPLKELLSYANSDYRAFTEKLVPDTKYEILGVKVPQIKSLAKKLVNNQDIALSYLKQPHTYYEEYFLCGFIICYLKTDYDKRVKLIEDFLPFIDNWAICDSVAMALKINKKDQSYFYSLISKWIRSNHEYTVRFAVVSLLHAYITNDYIHQNEKLLSTVKDGKYYIDMAIAWYYSFALIKFYNITIDIFKSKTLPRFIHNKALQKARESFRIPQDKKDYLKSLKY